MDPILEFSLYIKTIFSKIPFNIILPSVTRSPKWSLYFRLTYFSSLPLVCYVAHLYNLPWFNHRNSILWREQIMELFIMLFTPSSCYFSPLGPDNPFKTSDILSLRSYLNYFLYICVYFVHFLQSYAYRMFNSKEMYLHFRCSRTRHGMI